MRSRDVLASLALAVLVASFLFAAPAQAQGVSAGQGLATESSDAQLREKTLTSAFARRTRQNFGRVRSEGSEVRKLEGGRAVVAPIARSAEDRERNRHRAMSLYFPNEGRNRPNVVEFERRGSSRALRLLRYYQPNGRLLQSFRFGGQSAGHSIDATLVEPGAHGKCVDECILAKLADTLANPGCWAKNQVLAACLAILWIRCRTQCGWLD